MTTPDLTTCLETERLQLCAWRKDDLDSHYRWMNLPAVFRVLPVPGPISREFAAQVFEQILALKEEQGAQYAIWTREPLRLIGGIGLAERNLGGHHAGLSALIAETELWGQGYATEAARCVLQYAFEEWNLRKVWLKHHGFNKQARAVADSLGFTEVGRQREHCFIDGEWTDWVTMELWRDGVIR